MLILALTTDKLQVTTTTAAAISVHASYVDDASGSFTAGKQNTAISSATTTDVVSVPFFTTQDKTIIHGERPMLLCLKQ